MAKPRRDGKYDGEVVYDEAEIWVWDGSVWMEGGHVVPDRKIHQENPDA